MQIDEYISLTELFDTYGNLLSTEQHAVIQKILDLDLGESELAELFGKSRQSVHDSFTKAKAGLQTFEEKCKIVEFKKNLKKELLEVLKSLSEAQAKSKIEKIIEKL